LKLQQSHIKQTKKNSENQIKINKIFKEKIRRKKINKNPTLEE
jgi:hypothetical protein